MNPKTENTEKTVNTVKTATKSAKTTKSASTKATRTVKTVKEEKVNKTIKNPVEPQVALVNAWQLIDQSDGKPITLTVTESGAFYGYGGVNNYNGSLHDSFKNGSFVINGTVAATMKYAHGIRRETLFFQQLNQVDSWVVNNECILELRKDDQVILRFMRQNKSGK